MNKRLYMIPAPMQESVKQLRLAAGGALDAVVDLVGHETTIERALYALQMVCVEVALPWFLKNPQV